MFWILLSYGLVWHEHYCAYPSMNVVAEQCFSHSNPDVMGRSDQEIAPLDILIVRKPSASDSSYLAGMSPIHRITGVVRIRRQWWLWCMRRRRLEVWSSTIIDTNHMMHGPHRFVGITSSGYEYHCVGLILFESKRKRRLSGFVGCLGISFIGESLLRLLIG